MLCASFPPIQAAMVVAMEERTITESGVAMATARAVMVQGLANTLGFLMALLLASAAAS